MLITIQDNLPLKIGEYVLGSSGASALGFLSPSASRPYPHWANKVATSFVVTLAFDPYFESPTLPSLFLLFLSYCIDPLHSLRRSTRSFTFAFRHN
jgi:hypothetical protein